MVIDSHIHLYPESVYSDAAKWAASRNETYWQRCVAPQEGKSIQAWVSADQLLRDMDEAGIEKAVVLGWYWENHDTCRENLSWQLAWIQSHPDRLIAFTAFNANGGQAAIDLLKEGFDSGIKGIGELNPPAQHYHYNDEWLDKALELAGDRGAPVNFHVTDPNTHDYPGKIDTPFEALYELAKRHRNTKFIFAHLAGMMSLPELSRLENVYIDTAATPLLYDSSIYHTAFEQYSPDRILFGTDYPLRTFPKQQKSPNFTRHLNRIRNSNLQSDLQQKLLNTNAKSLLSLIPSA